MTNKPSQDKLDEIKSNFDFFDDDSNGKIDLNEFIKLLNIIEPTATKEQAEEGFTIIDDDNNGVIDFAEFINWWQSYWWQY
ncbi:MAG: EF-hand domain-containing protein [Gammaproteobacteria bacterium]|nr:EF-hand domain-containing protein [Gammaproteobacteria bacterium]